MRALTLSVIATLTAPAAFAETCTFTLECYENETCQETAFEMTVEDDKLITDAETIPVSTGGSATVNVFVGYSPSAFHVLTREIDGAARYSTHMFADITMINYLGTCS